VRTYIANGFKVGPNYCRPAAPVADDWIDADDLRIRHDSPDTSQWWRVFGDPVLDSLVNAAYQQNLTLREAGFRVLQARAAYAITVGQFFPQSQEMFGGYSRNVASKANANSGFLQDQFFDRWDTGFGLAWELDFWGRFRRAIEAADADLDAQVENYDDVLVTLIADIASTYVDLRVLEQEIALVKGNIALQQQTLTITTARFRGGQTSELDVDQAQSNLSQTQALLPQFEIRHRVANNRLCILLGMPAAELATLIGPGGIPVAPVEVAVGIPAELLSRRPDIRRAERTVAAQSARVGVATTELYPHISIVGTIGWQSKDLDGLLSPAALQGNTGPGFRWNILNYGRLVNNIRLQDARLQELIVNYQNTVLNAGAEVENGLVTFLESQRRVRYMDQSVVAAQQAVRISLAQYRGGVVDFNRVALLEQNLVQQQDLQAQARGAVADGLIQVYRALGGGWQLRLAPPQAPNLPPVDAAPGWMPDADAIELIPPTEGAPIAPEVIAPPAELPAARLMPLPAQRGAPIQPAAGYTLAPSTHFGPPTPGMLSRRTHSAPPPRLLPAPTARPLAQ
jgi:NodT family efflux transporter outer membrane factor (OMF) lipoprotein